MGSECADSIHSPSGSPCGVSSAWRWSHGTGQRRGQGRGCGDRCIRMGL